MTHWLVKVAKIGSAFKIVGQRIKEGIKQQWKDNRQEFLETALALSINLAAMSFFLFWLVLPIPKQQTCTTYALSCLNTAKPPLLHVFALAGIVFFFGFSVRQTKTYIEMLDKYPIRYIKYVRANYKSKREMQ